MATLEICLEVSHKVKVTYPMVQKFHYYVFTQKKSTHAYNETCTRIFLSYFLSGDSGGFILPPSPFLGSLQMINTESQKENSPKHYS